MQISNRREQDERSRGYAVLRHASVCHTDFLVGLWSYDQGQQPFGGVGRLYLSFIRHAEPQGGKCNDLRLFLFPYKIWRSSLRNGGELHRCK